MTKKQILAGSLAALMLMTGCSANKSKAENNKGERNIPQESEICLEENTPEVIDYEGYRISIIDTTPVTDYFGNTQYIAPVGYDIMNKEQTKAYKVEKKVVIFTYQAEVRILEDGTIIYRAFRGGEIKGTKAVISSYEKVSEEESYEIINNYLNEAKLTKTL